MQSVIRQPRKFRDLAGYGLRARDGEIGKLLDVYFDDGEWVVRYFVVRTGGWLLGRHALIVPAVVSRIDDDEQVCHVELTREQIRNCPPVDTALPVSRHYEREYFRYYGWQPYWRPESLVHPTGVVPPVPAMPPRAGEKPAPPEHPHLRSGQEVAGYAIRASDGPIGHVADVILEDPGWLVRYLEVDTRDWLPGRHVLVAPAWIREVDWAAHEVAVDLPQEAVRSAPPYERGEVISRDYQVALYRHYGRTFEEQGTQ